MNNYQFNATTNEKACEYCFGNVSEGFMFNEDQYFCDLDCFVEYLLMKGKLEIYGGNENE